MVLCTVVTLNSVLLSVSVLAEASVKSPCKWSSFIILKKIFLDLTIQKTVYIILKTGALVLLMY